ncbi:hypothetical protein NMG60_11023727 [Bertholletia excelsa]
MVGCGAWLDKRNSNWVTNLLHSKFFGSCVDHRDLRKNEKNVFCIDCNLCFCKHCIASSAHCFHRWLQICRYVYHDVVRIQDIQKYLDCSKIQTYKINGEKAVHLNPRPQPKDAKSSKSKTGVRCEACGRHIQDFPNSFCSIACKVSAVEDMSNESSHGMISLPMPVFSESCMKENYNSEENTVQTESSISFQDSFCESSEGVPGRENPALKPKKQLQKRKGFPRRSPLR